MTDNYLWQLMLLNWIGLQSSVFILSFNLNWKWYLEYINYISPSTVTPISKDYYAKESYVCISDTYILYETVLVYRSTSSWLKNYQKNKKIKFQRIFYVSLSLFLHERSISVHTIAFLTLILSPLRVFNFDSFEVEFSWFSDMLIIFSLLFVGILGRITLW